METNRTPLYDASDNPTGCCPRFKPDGWDDQTLHFEDKPFVRAKTRSVLHVPVNMGKVFEKTFHAIEDADAMEEAQSIVLSRDLSSWSAEHFFAVTKDVEGEEMSSLSGDFRTKVFEGAYREAPTWIETFTSELEAEGFDVSEVFFFYTTCPKCAKTYGRNCTVAVAHVKERDAE